MRYGFGKRFQSLRQVLALRSQITDITTWLIWSLMTVHDQLFSFGSARSQIHPDRYSSLHRRMERLLPHRPIHESIIFKELRSKCNFPLGLDRFLS